VCVQQTALDLLSLGYEVHVVVDATSSRTDTDRMFAFQVGKRGEALQCPMGVRTSPGVPFKLKLLSAEDEASGCVSDNQ